MNEEDVSKLLDDVVPSAPSVKGWAGRAAGRVRRRRVVTGALAAVVALGIPIGLTISQQGAGPLEATPQPADSSTAVATKAPLPPGEVLYTGVVSLWQHEGQEFPNICMGTVMESYPPQCPGPSVRGDFSWGEVEFSEDAGLRQSGLLEVVGTYDPDDGLTLTEPPVAVQPEALPTSSVPEGPPFEQLCTDMLIDADPAKADSTSVTRLQNQLDELPVVKTWVSDGVDAFNVLVQGDAGAVFEQLRTVWGGELCVETAAAPTQAELQAAMDRVWASVPQGTLYGGSGENYPDATLTYPVVIAPPELVATLEEAAGPDFAIVLTPSLAPLATSTPSTSTSVPEPTAGSSERQELVGHGVIFQGPEDDRPRIHICESDPFQSDTGYTPPVCQGPELIGDFSWGDVVQNPRSPLNGFRWTISAHQVLGYLDLTDGPYGSFTLTAPVVHSEPVPSQEPLGGALSPVEPVKPPTASEVEAAAIALELTLARTGNFISAGIGEDESGPLLNLRVVISDETVRDAIAAHSQAVAVETRAFFSPLLASAPPNDTESTPVLTGRFAIYEDRETGEPYLCDGNIGYSLPPICGRGPTVKGEFSWADVEFADQVWRWTDDEYLVEGHYDPDDGEYGSFTLLEPPTLATEPVAEVPGHAELAELCTRPGATSSAGVDGIRIQLTSVFDDDLIENLPWEGASIDPSGGIGLRTSDCAPLIGPVSNADLRAAADDIAEAIPESFQGITALSVIGPDSPRDPEVQVLMGVLSPEWLTEIRKAAAGSGPVVVRTLLTPVGDAEVTVVVP